MQGGMNHHGSGSADNQLNGSFSHSILPLSTHSTEPDALLFIQELLSEGFAGEQSIVSVVVLNGDPELPVASLSQASLALMVSVALQVT